MPSLQDQIFLNIEQEFWSESSTSTSLYSESDSDFSSLDSRTRRRRNRRYNKNRSFVKKSRLHSHSSSKKNVKKKYDRMEYDQDESDGDDGIYGSEYSTSANEYNSDNLPLNRQQLRKLLEKKVVKSRKDGRNSVSKSKSPRHAKDAPDTERAFWEEVDAKISCTDLIPGCQTNPSMDSTTSSISMLENPIAEAELPQPTKPIPSLAQLAQLSQAHKSDHSVLSVDSLTYSVNTSTDGGLKPEQMALILETMSLLAENSDDEHEDTDDHQIHYLPAQDLWAAEEVEEGIDLILNTSGYMDIIQDASVHESVLNFFPITKDKQEEKESRKVALGDPNHHGKIEHSNSSSSSASKLKANHQNITPPSSDLVDKEVNSRQLIKSTVVNHSLMDAYRIESLVSPSSSSISHEIIPFTNENTIVEKPIKRVVTFSDQIEYELPTQRYQIYHHNSATIIQRWYKKRRKPTMNLVQLIKLGGTIQVNAAIKIQSFVRGRSCRHSILCEMGVAKRRKWEPRTKTAQLTRLHSKIRRSARAFLRSRPDLLTSIIYAIRRICAIKIQRCFRLYLSKKIGPVLAIKRICAIRIQRWIRQSPYRLVQRKTTPYGAATMIQKTFRGYVARVLIFSKQIQTRQKYDHVSAATIIQSIARTYILRKRYLYFQKLQISKSPSNKSFAVSESVPSDHFPTGDSFDVLQHETPTGSVEAEGKIKVDPPIITLNSLTDSNLNLSSSMESQSKSPTTTPIHKVIDQPFDEVKNSMISDIDITPISQENSVKEFERKRPQLPQLVIEERDDQNYIHNSILDSSTDFQDGLQSSPWDKFRLSEEKEESESTSLLSAYRRSKRFIVKNLKKLRRKKYEKKSFSKPKKPKSPLAIARRLVSGKKSYNKGSPKFHSNILNENRSDSFDPQDDSSANLSDGEASDDDDTQPNYNDATRTAFSPSFKKASQYETLMEDDESVSSGSQDDADSENDQDAPPLSYMVLDDDNEEDDDNDNDVTKENKLDDSPSWIAQENHHEQLQFDAEFVFDPFNIASGVEIVSPGHTNSIPDQYQSPNSGYTTGNEVSQSPQNDNDPFSEHFESPLSNNPLIQVNSESTSTPSNQYPSQGHTLANTLDIIISDQNKRKYSVNETTTTPAADVLASEITQQQAIQIMKEEEPSRILVSIGSSELSSAVAEVLPSHLRTLSFDSNEMGENHEDTTLTTTTPAVKTVAPSRFKKCLSWEQPTEQQFPMDETVENDESDLGVPSKEESTNFSLNETSTSALTIDWKGFDRYAIEEKVDSIMAAPSEEEDYLREENF